MAKFIPTLCLVPWLMTVVLLLMIGFGVRTATARRHPLLIEDEGTRRNRPAECQFGKTIRELHSTWFADLGPPFGVMYCIMCECVPFPKKRRVVGRVQCRNIKNECPKVTCEDPILFPGRCCKACPGDTQSPDIPQDLPQATMPEEEERSKHFAALLTGRTSSFLRQDDEDTQYTTSNPQNVIATGRFSFHKKNLYYSFYVSPRASRPRSIQFVHANGNILEEHTLAIATDAARFSVYQNATGKVCGVWRRVPREYRRLLRDELVSVVLLWGSKNQAELAIAGLIARYPALAHELFSSLLEPASTDIATNSDPKMGGAGGTAIVSTSSGVTSSIHLTLVLNGLFAPDEISDVPLLVRLETADRRQLILEDVQRIRKPSHELNVLELSSPVSINDLRLLTRGKLALTVESKRNPDALRLHGAVRARVACEIFQTLLTPAGMESTTADASGMAWMYLNREGTLVYQVQTHAITGGSLSEPIITLLDDSAKRKPEVETLTVHHRHQHHSEGQGAATELIVSGTVERMGPRLLEPLYAAELAVNVAASDQNLTMLHGKFVTRHVADARDAGAPVLLLRPSGAISAESTTLGGHALGMAWLAVDNECNLHYDLSLAGVPSSMHPLSLFIEELPLEAPNAPVHRRLLQEFSGNHLEGFALELPTRELAKLETSVIYLEVRSNATRESLLRSKVRSVTRVPHHCSTGVSVASSGGQDNEVQQHHYPFLANDLPTGLVSAESSKCFHANRFYDEGVAWRSALETCTMCSCDHRQVKCEAIRCPPLQCRNEDIVQQHGDCCATCNTSKYAGQPSNTDSAVDVVLGPTAIERGCHLGDEFHTAGSTWHPYLHPSGFEVCTICSCELFTLQVKCSRAHCQPLTCSEKVAYRPDKKACCKVCPQVKEPKVSKKGLQNNRESNKDELQDEAGSVIGTLRSAQTILAAGGCRYDENIYENGQEYHPILATHGEEKCIKCRCKDGKLNCNRKRCSQSKCHRQFAKRLTQQQQSLDECCPCRPARHQRKRQQQQQHH
ncbi:dorsal-ventral patterning protein Sog [Anopheles cruzii]|uniref:dorsal-ventral patterning protein Sog n=1 Tax=Anopheles cruzii TaxID=68878 RepID=UPI0022EC8DEB|nr:dorsal-ventral patterning protein Sog [Anopheles cruzii]